MTEPPLWLRDVENRAAGKPVLLVEGDDDAMLLGHYLTQHAPGWETRLVLLPAQGKQRVVSGVCVHRPDWIGMIDLDQVVVQILDGLFSGKGADDWLQKFQDAKMQPPPDLRGILDQILHLVSANV